jgi:O-antigen ligase
MGKERIMKDMYPSAERAGGVRNGRGGLMEKYNNIQKDPFADNCASIISGVISVFLLVLVVGLPLYLHNSYFDILEAKYKWYYGSFFAMLVIVLVLSLIMLVIDFKEFGGDHVKKLFSALKPANWKKTFHPADAAILVFWLAALISTFQSEYFYESFWGNEGRYSGLFLMTLYVVMYFIVSRFWKFRGWVVHAFLLAGLIVCLIGITDYFQMDIFGFRVRIKPSESAIFTSTIGNINTYTAFVALVMGAAAGVFVTTQKRVELIWSYVCLFVTFMAIIMGCSDNAYLALGALFAFMPLMLFRSRKGVIRYLVMVSTFATVIQCIDFINHKYEGIVLGLDSLFKIVANLPGLMVLVLALWAITITVYVTFKRNLAATGMAAAAQKQDMGELSPVLRRVWIIFLVAAFLIVVFLLVDANVLGHGERYSSLANYLVFNDEWGTSRGYIWRKSMEAYGKFPLKHKLFGYGPDTFGILTTDRFFGDMINATGLIFDNAHNEYLQFLLTIGPIGLIAYWVFLALSCRGMLRCTTWRKYAAACMFAVICYCFQAAVNLNLPITAPLLWGMLSMGGAAARFDSAEK